MNKERSSQLPTKNPNIDRINIQGVNNLNSFMEDSLSYARIQAMKTGIPANQITLVEYLNDLEKLVNTSS